MELFRPLIGCHHQPNAVDSATVDTTTTSIVMPSFVTSQRTLPTACEVTSLAVPFSRSWANMGAPRKTPSRTGRQPRAKVTSCMCETYGAKPVCQSSDGDGSGQSKPLR